MPGTSYAATPPGWYVGRPGQRHGGQWAIYAFDTTEESSGRPTIARVSFHQRRLAMVGHRENTAHAQIASLWTEFDLPFLDL